MQRRMSERARPWLAWCLGAGLGVLGTHEARGQKGPIGLAWSPVRVAAADDRLAGRPGGLTAQVVLRIESALGDSAAAGVELRLAPAGPVLLDEDALRPMAIAGLDSVVVTFRIPRGERGMITAEVSVPGRDDGRVAVRRSALYVIAGDSALYTSDTGLLGAELLWLQAELLARRLTTVEYEARVAMLMSSGGDSPPPAPDRRQP